MVRTFPDCCACAASGYAAAAPPSAASNSRRPMVTVIRPSRARCVKERYHATSVLSLTARVPDDVGSFVVEEGLDTVESDFHMDAFSLYW
jgi:hypothetical protein